MFDTDPISQLITRTKADVTATQAPQVAPQRTIGPAPTRAPQAKPVGGALGALFSAGESVHNGIVERAQAGPKKSDALTALALAFPELKAMRAAAPVAEAAAPVAEGLTTAQLTEWRNIAKALNYQNDANRAERGVREFRAMRAAALPGASPSPNAAALRNMMETGFAGGKTAAMVELPVSGAGRAGSTATAMKTALTQTTPAQFRSLVDREIALRGGATAPEVSMAATEEVARKLASGMR